MNDPAWDMPFQNWQPQGSYENPVAPPDVDPSAGTPVCIGPIAAEWLPFIQGAMDQFRNPSSWLVADDAAMAVTLNRVTMLRELFNGYGACVSYALRFQDCELQSSSDGGETWTTVSGWDTNFCTCVNNCVSPIGIPPVPPGGPTGEQLSCNIAAYVAIQIIQLSFEKQVANVGLTNTLFSLATEIAGTLVGVGFVWTEVFVSAVAIVYEAITAMHLSDFEAAIADPLLWHEVQCCIFEAIKADGQFNATNFPGLLTCLSGISYSHADVVSAIHDYVQAIGWHGLAELSQPAGTSENADCSECGSEWCIHYDFAADGFDTWDNIQGYYEPGQGIGSLPDPPGTGHDYIQIRFFTLASHLTSIDAEFSASGPAASTADRQFLMYDGTTVIDNIPLTSGAIHFHQTYADIPFTGFYIRFFDTPASGHTSFIRNITIRGTGANPFSPSNC